MIMLARNLRTQFNDLSSNQAGGISLIAVTFSSLLMLIITLAMVGMMIGELRQSIDAENGVKAYYAAESGAEEALFGLKTALSSGVALSDLNQECDNIIAAGALNQYFHSDLGSVNDSAAGTQITCRSIRTNGAPIGVVGQDKIATFDLSGHNVDSIQVNWDHENDASGPNIPDLGVTITTYPQGSTIANVGQVPTDSVLLQPCQPASPTAACPDRNAAPNKINLQNSFSTGTYPFQTFCSSEAPTANSYRCHATLTNVAPAGTFAVLRLRPLSYGASYSLKIIDSSGASVNVRLQDATVDVTARVGDSFRRIRQQIEVRSGAFEGLDVISSQQDICKDFDYNISPGYTSITPKICPIN